MEQSSTRPSAVAPRDSDVWLPDSLRDGSAAMRGGRTEGGPRPKSDWLPAPDNTDRTPLVPGESRRPSRRKPRRWIVLALATAAVLLLIGMGILALSTFGGDAPAPDRAPREAAGKPLFDPGDAKLLVLAGTGGAQATGAAARKLKKEGFEVRRGEAGEGEFDHTVVFHDPDPDRFSRRAALAAKRRLLPLRSVTIQAYDGDWAQDAGRADAIVLAGPDLLDPPKR